jgi:hypothetical protein
MTKLPALVATLLATALATPAWSLGPTVRTCTSAVRSGDFVAEIEARSEGAGPTKTSVTFSLPMVSAAAPGGRILPSEEARRLLKYDAVNGEFSFRILQTKWLEGSAGRLQIDDGWSITTTRWTLPVAEAAGGRAVQKLEVLVGGQRYTFGVRERLDIDGAPEGVLRPGLVPVGVTSDVVAVFNALRTAEDVEVRAIDADGAPVVTARFKAPRFTDLLDAARLDAGFVEEIHAGKLPCDRSESTLEEWTGPTP